MDSGSPTPKNSKKGRWRKILKRSLWVALTLIALLAVFHRPILRWGLEWGGKRLAQSAGYDLQWEVRGSVVSDVTVRDVKLRGPESSVLKSITWKEAGAGYNLWKLMREGTGEFLNRLSLSNATIELDTRVPKPLKARKESAKGPPELWVGRVNLRNVNLRVSTSDGVIEMRGLTLVVDEASPGELTIEELTIPSSSLHLTQVRGKTTVSGRTVIITDLNVTPEVQIARVELGLGDLEDSALPFKIEMHSGEGSLTASGRVEDMNRRLRLDAEVRVNQLAHTEIARWVGLPKNLAWRIETATLEIHGPPADPQGLDGTLVLDASGLRVGATSIDRLQALAAIDDGTLRVESIKAQAGPNEADVSGSAALPSAWRDMKRLSAELQWRLNVPSLESFFQVPSDYGGSVRGAGTVALKEGRLGGAAGTIDGTQLRYRHWSPISLKGEVATDAESVQIKSLTAKLEERNLLQVSGKIGLSDRQPADLKWTAKLDDLTAVARTAGWKGADEMRAEKLEGGGTVQFEVADLREKNFRELTARGSAALENLSWQARRMQQVVLEFDVKGAKAEVSKLDVVFDEQNRGHFSGAMQLEDRQLADLKWQIDLRSLSTMGAWLAWKPDAPLPQSGTLASQGSASASVADLRARELTQATGEGTLDLDGLVAGKARFDHAAVAFGLREGRVELKKLEARLDASNHVNARGSAMLDQFREFALEVDATLPRLENLSGWVEMFKGPKVTGGSAMISWRGSGKPAGPEIKGDGTLKLTGVKLADRPAFSVSLATKHEGRRAQLTGLQASTGSFRVEAEAEVTETEVRVPEISVHSGDLPLVTGSVELPTAFAQQPRLAIPLDPTRPLKVSLHIAKLDLAKLFASFGIKPPVTGIANGEVNLKGTLPELEGNVDLVLSEMRAGATKGKLDAATLTVKGSLTDDKLSLKAGVDQKPLRSLTITGALPFDAEKVMRDPKSMLDSEIEAQLQLPESDLSIIRRFVPTLATLEGTVAADVKISGPLRSPHWQGALRADAPSATFEKTPMGIRDLKARVSFEDKQIKFDDVSAILAGGAVRVVGGMNVTDLKSPLVDLRLEARQALIVRNESLSARANGTITCKGTLQKADIAGRVELVRCRVFKEIEFLPLSLPNHLPPPPPAVQVRKPPAMPPPFGDWTLNVDIVTSDSIRLLGNVLNGGATTSLHLGGTGAAPTLEGEVSFEGARVRLPNSKLTITRGKLIFTKDKPFEPTLDVLGDSLVGNYEVSINAYGSAFAPKVRFNSSPPLSEGEIATLLATGTVGGGDRAAAGAAANLAAFQVLSKAYRRVFDKAAPKRYDEEPPRLTFSFSPLSTGTSEPGVSASYEISDKLQATGAVTERGTFRGMLYYMVRLR
jgi:autotransporter translocation and assembly factor TamB